MRKEHALKVVELLMGIPVEMEPTIHCIHAYTNAIIAYVHVMYPNGIYKVFRYILRFSDTAPETALHAVWEITARYDTTNDNSAVTGKLQAYSRSSLIADRFVSDEVKKGDPWTMNRDQVIRDL